MMEYEVQIKSTGCFKKNVQMFDIRLSSFLGVLKINLGHFSIALSMYIVIISKFLLFDEIWNEIMAK